MMKKVEKLIKQNKQFIVIGEHEPYYLKAYQMICEQEKKQNTWTIGDEYNFRLAVEQQYGLEKQNES